MGDVFGSIKADLTVKIRCCRQDARGWNYRSSVVLQAISYKGDHSAEKHSLKGSFHPRLSQGALKCLEQRVSAGMKSL